MQSATKLSDQETKAKYDDAVDRAFKITVEQKGEMMNEATFIDGSTSKAFNCNAEEQKHMVIDPFMCLAC